MSVVDEYIMFGVLVVDGWVVRVSVIPGWTGCQWWVDGWSGCQS